MAPEEESRMEKLTLEPLTAAHGAELLALWQDEAVVRYTNIALPCTPEEAERRADTLARFDTFVLRLEGELVGIAGCPAVDRAARRFGVFYQLRPAFWGRAGLYGRKIWGGPAAGRGHHEEYRQRENFTAFSVYSLWRGAAGAERKTLYGAALPKNLWAAAQPWGGK